MKVYKVYDIKWDANRKERMQLPSIVRVQISDNQVSDINNKEEVEDFISEYLIEDNGFFHDGFKYKEITPNN